MSDEASESLEESLARLKELNEAVCECDRRVAEVRAASERLQASGNLPPVEQRCTKLRRFCDAVTHAECGSKSCDMLHFNPIILPHTAPAAGDCSYLDSCRSRTCKRVHYELDVTSEQREDITAEILAEERFAKKRREVLPPCIDDKVASQAFELGIPGAELVGGSRYSSEDAEKNNTSAVVPSPFSAEPMQGATEAQWLKCDLRSLDLRVLGRFDVIVADPPWDIHMDLSYGTMRDDELCKLDFGSLVTDGVLFLWVTGRVLELARVLMDVWGFRLVDEIVWVKTTQLQRVVRGRQTGHWLNHTKEHCLVGVRGNPKMNRFIDTNVIVSGVRESSRKPDELYSMIQRLMPHARCLEIFGREHNIRPGWLTLGNQLPNPPHIVDRCVLDAIQQKYGSMDAFVASCNRRKKDQANGS